MTLKEFKEKIQMYASIKQWMPQQMLLIATTQLKGPVKVVKGKLKRKNPNYTFSDLTSVLQQKFAGPDYLLQLKDKPREIKQKEEMAAQLVNALDDAFLTAELMSGRNVLSEASTKTQYSTACPATWRAYLR